jgi:phenylalanyl-tRNA synthetase beta chain
MEVIKKTGGRLLSDIDVFDVYTGENVAPTEKSIAYTLTFQDETRTLTEVEVMELFNKIITEVETKCNAKLRMN